MIRRPKNRSGEMAKLLLGTIALLGGAMWPASLTGCGDPLGGLGDLLPSQAEITAWEDYSRELMQSQEDFDNGPTVAVRVVNRSAAAARVLFVSAVEPPAPPPDMDSIYAGADGYYSPISATEAVLVSAGGTAAGAVHCGDTIAISALAPLDAEPFYTAEYFVAAGFHTEPGNIVLSGAGVAPDSEFSGDVITTVRLVRPAADGLDCAANTLVITIQTAATESVYDPATGVLISGAAPGSASISIE
jgi:hypothetical protein